MNNNSTTQNINLDVYSFLFSIEDERIKNLEESFSDYFEYIERQIENRNGSSESTADELFSELNKFKYY